MKLLDRFKRDRAKADDEAWFARAPHRRYRARLMTKREWRNYCRGFRLDAAPLPDGFRWIIVTHRRDDGSTARMPVAWSARLDPIGIPEAVAERLFIDTQAPLREWGEALGYEMAGAA
jgi:hypothetical protein